MMICPRYDNSVISWAEIMECTREAVSVKFDSTLFFQPECFWACGHTHCTEPHGDIAWSVEFVYGTYVAYVSSRPIRGKWGLCNWMNGFDISLQRLTIWFHCTGSSVCQWETVAISSVHLYNFSTVFCTVILTISCPQNLYEKMMYICKV